MGVPATCLQGDDKFYSTPDMFDSFRSVERTFTQGDGATESPSVKTHKLQSF